MLAVLLMTVGGLPLRSFFEPWVYELTGVRTSHVVECKCRLNLWVYVVADFVCFSAHVAFSAFAFFSQCHKARLKSSM